MGIDDCVEVDERDELGVARRDREVARLVEAQVATRVEHADAGQAPRFVDSSIRAAVVDQDDIGRHVRRGEDRADARWHQRLRAEGDDDGGDAGHAEEERYHRWFRIDLGGGRWLEVPSRAATGTRHAGWRVGSTTGARRHPFAAANRCRGRPCRVDARPFELSGNCASGRVLHRSCVSTRSDRTASLSPVDRLGSGSRRVHPPCRPSFRGLRSATSGVGTTQPSSAGPRRGGSGGPRRCLARCRSPR